MERLYASGSQLRPMHKAGKLAGPAFTVKTERRGNADPTPAADASGAFDRGGWLNALADLGDYLKHLWSNYVVGLNAERQRDAIYRPLAQIATNVEQLVERPMQRIDR